MRCRTGIFSVALALGLLAGPHLARAAGKLGVMDAWIRAAPPGTEMMAGYATLKNTGDERISVLTVQSDTFRESSIHETIVTQDVTKMRELSRLDLEPGETVEMRPGGRHLMLSGPRHPVSAGDKVGMVFLLTDGARVQTYFDVVAPDGGSSD
jgi:copper(I)-binding protein